MYPVDTRGVSSTVWSYLRNVSDSLVSAALVRHILPFNRQLCLMRVNFPLWLSESGSVRRAETRIINFTKIPWAFPNFYVLGLPYPFSSPDIPCFQPKKFFPDVFFEFVKMSWFRPFVMS